MSQENVEIVRQPITVRAKSHRRVEERLGLRFPRVPVFLTRAIWRLPPRSRLRQAWIRRALQSVAEASNRRDYEVAFMLVHPDIESTYPAQFASLGVGRSTMRGREERIAFQRTWEAEWGDFRYDWEEVIDLGNRLLVLGHVKGSGVSSGATIDNECAYLFTLSAGQAIREQFFLDHIEGLEAAGLRE